MTNKKTMNTKQWFDRWSNEYDRTLGSIGFHRDLLDLAVRHCPLKAAQTLLDIGCGTGLLSLKFLRKYPCRVVGIDASEQMLAIFKEKIKKLKLADRIGLRSMDARRLAFGAGTFDAAVSTVTLHHVVDKLPVIRSVCRTLKPGGVFVIGEVDMDTTGNHADPGRLKRILRVLEQEWIPAMKDAGIEAFSKMFDNGKKHILNDGEYCVSLRQWAALCRKAGFRRVVIKRVPGYKAFGIVVARK